MLFARDVPSKLSLVENTSNEQFCSKLNLSKRNGYFAPPAIYIGISLIISSTRWVRTQLNNVETDYKAISCFSGTLGFASLVKEPIQRNQKNSEKPACIDLILLSNLQSFQNSSLVVVTVTATKMIF